MKRTACLATLLIVLSGCASSLSMKPSVAKQIDSLVVAPDIRVPQALYYQGRDSLAWTAVAGGVGAGIAGATIGEGIRLKAIEDEIFIEEIVSHALTDEVCTNIRCNVDKRPRTEATLFIEIPVYGLTIVNPFSKVYAGLLKVNARIEIADDVVWKDSVYVNPVYSEEGLYTFTKQDYEDNPLILRDAWTSAARVASQRLVQTIPVEKP